MLYKYIYFFANFLISTYFLPADIKKETDGTVGLFAI